MSLTIRKYPERFALLMTSSSFYNSSDRSLYSRFNRSGFWSGIAPIDSVVFAQDFPLEMNRLLMSRKEEKNVRRLKSFI